MSSELLAPDLSEAVVADHCHLRIPSLPEWIEPTVDYLVERARMCGALHPNRTTRVMMALIEAVTNAIIHGSLGISSALKEQGDREYADAIASRCADPNYASRIVDIRGTWNGQSLHWIVSDQGAGFDVEAALRRLDEPEQDLLRPSGRGLIMIRAFMDEMRYEDRGRRLHLVLRGNHASENREAARHPCHASVSVTPVSEQGTADWSATHTAQVRNISSGGMALLQSRLAVRDRILITIPGRDGSDPVVIPAEVRRSQALSESVLEVGCRFDVGCPPPASASASLPEVLALVERIEESLNPQAERRGATRLPYSECVEIELGDGTQTRGFGRDLSRSGIAFFTTRPLPPGEMHLLLPQPSGAAPIRVVAQMVRCTLLTEGFYDVAARFLAH